MIEKSFSNLISAIAADLIKEKYANVCAAGNRRDVL
jgi:hypothetical protein